MRKLEGRGGVGGGRSSVRLWPLGLPGKCGPSFGGGGFEGNDNLKTFS
jgi:hypothetical protein